MLPVVVKNQYGQRFQYFHLGLTILSPSEWLKAAAGDCEDEYHQSEAEDLKTYLPLLWKQIEERALERGCHVIVFS